MIIKRYVNRWYPKLKKFWEIYWPKLKYAFNLIAGMFIAFAQWAKNYCKRMEIAKLKLEEEQEMVRMERLKLA